PLPYHVVLPRAVEHRPARAPRVDMLHPPVAQLPRGREILRFNLRRPPRRPPPLLLRRLHRPLRLDLRLKPESPHRPQRRLPLPSSLAPPLPCSLARLSMRARELGSLGDRQLDRLHVLPARPLRDREHDAIRPQRPAGGLERVPPL